MSGHTPGPWIAEEDETVDSDGTQFESAFPWLIEAGTCTVAGVSGIGGEAAANARLIAAAPDLLAALRAIADPKAPDNLGEPLSRLILAQEIARRAIAKADGR
jgi:hypothetical protein